MTSRVSMWALILAWMAASCSDDRERPTEAPDTPDGAGLPLGGTDADAAAPLDADSGPAEEPTGAIVQVGTPQDIVLAPATAYVAEFTRSVPRAKVVKAAAIMRPVNGVLPEAVIAARATVAEAAPLFAAGVERLRVVDAAGETLGMLDRDSVIDVMMRG